MSEQAQAPERPEMPFTDDDAAAAWAASIDPMDCFSPHGSIQAMTLGACVMVMGPLARGTDGRVWRYRRGVYVPDGPGEDTIRSRTVALLGDLYRPGHATIARDVVLASAPVLGSDPVEHLINVPNGMLDWRTGTLYAHTPDVLSTVQLGVRWDPAATCPWFDWWLAQVVPPDCIELVWELTGYLAYCGNPLHAAVMLVGDGRNGKGTYLRLVKAMLGEANVTAVSLTDLVSTRFATASLFGKIANVAGDIDGTYLESTAVLKAVTGGDMISAEHKGKDRFDFTPWAVPVFSANKIPASADTTVGYLSRWLVIPFPNSFAGREDRTIEDRLRPELPGILAGGLRRLPALLARGQFGLTDSAREAKAEFERRVDSVRYWLSEYCETGDYPMVNRTELYAAYKRVTDRDGGRPLKAGEFYDRLTRIGIPAGRTNTMRGYSGVKVTDDGWPALSGLPGR
jgi:putative DNA primase/helicase